MTRTPSGPDSGMGPREPDPPDPPAPLGRSPSAAVNFRNEIVTGPGGLESQLKDPSGDPIELFQQAARHPHRRELRVPRSADRPPTQGPQTLRLHLRLQRGLGLGATQGESPDRTVHDQPGPVPADRSAQPSPSGLGELLPTRRG